MIDGAIDIKVSLYDKREFEARVVGTDPKTDLAVIKVEQAGLQPVNLGDSSKVQVGGFGTRDWKSVRHRTNRNHGRHQRHGSGRAWH